jgi:hypothetical protein
VGRFRQVVHLFELDFVPRPYRRVARGQCRTSARDWGIVPSDQADNDPVETYAALLIADDPTGQAAVAFHNVSDLTKAEFDRYSEAYDTLEDILVANMMAYFLTCAVAFATQGVLILISTSVTARRFAAALASKAAALTFRIRSDGPRCTDCWCVSGRGMHLRPAIPGLAV